MMEAPIYLDALIQSRARAEVCERAVLILLLVAIAFPLPTARLSRATPSPAPAVVRCPRSAPVPLTASSFRGPVAPMRAALRSGSAPPPVAPAPAPGDSGARTAGTQRAPAVPSDL